MRYQYKKIDAFTGGESLGNPAACILLGDKIMTAEQMLAIGREHKGFVSEVVFVSNSKTADCKLTYYSSEREVDFCGHGTIATMYDYIKNRPELSAKHVITIETNMKGMLEVHNHINDLDAVFIEAPKIAEHSFSVTKSQIASALRISEDVIDTSLPIAHIEAGLKTLIVPIRSLADEISIWPDEMELRQFVVENDLVNILIFSIESSDKNAAAHTRVFAPKFGYLEDPATGSSNSAFAAYPLPQ